MIKNWLSELTPEQEAVIREIYIEHRFKTYDVITTIINEKLGEWGCELTVSRSSAHRLGQKLEKYIKLTQQYTHLAENDLNTGLSSSLATIVHLELIEEFQKNSDIDLETKAKLINASSGAIRANVMQKRYLSNYIEKKKLEKNLNTYATKKGLSQEDVATLRAVLMHDVLEENEKS